MLMGLLLLVLHLPLFPGQLQLAVCQLASSWTNQNRIMVQPTTLLFWMRSHMPVNYTLTLLGSHGRNSKPRWLYCGLRVTPRCGGKR